MLTVESSISGHLGTDIQFSYQRTFTVSFSKNDFTFNSLKGYDYITMSDAGISTEIGKPMVPVKHINIAIPTNIKVTNIRINELKEQNVDGSFNLYPTQPPLQIIQTERDHQFVYPDTKTYQSMQTYPINNIEMRNQNDLAGQSIVQIAIYPLHYIPSQKQLTMITSITFTIEGIKGFFCGDYLSRHISDDGRAMYQKMVQNMVMNPEDVELRYSPIPQPAGVDPGDYDYVIITQDSWIDAFLPLKDWKTRKGIPANIVTTTWIYNSGGYTGSNVEKIQAFIQDAYTNWGTIFILLGGDVNVVPCHYKTFSSVNPDPVANDAFYADFDADWVCEVNVGRASVTGPGSGAGQIGSFINKVLMYEKNPPLSNYAKKAGFFGFDLDGNTHAQLCKIAIDNSYIPSDWMMTAVYDNHSGNHKINTIAAINAGQNLMNHADHSGSDFMGTGYINHGIGLENSDMDMLTNGNRQSIFYSMGCDPAAYDQSNCIGEHFVRNGNGGGVAFIGNSRYGWYYSGSYTTLSMKYDIEFFKSIFQDNFYKLGVAFSDHKNDGVETSAVSKYCFTELTLLGDPELPLWKENPMSISVTHPNQIPVGSSSFTVSVKSGSNPMNQAYVCLWKGSDVYLTGNTNSTGEILFNLSIASPGTMYVTVTKQNYLPYEGSVAVLGGNNNPPQKPTTPSGATNGGINIEYTYKTNTTDPDQDQIWYQWKFGSYTTNWFGPYACGTEVQAEHIWTMPGTYEVTVKAKDQYDYESDWSSPLFVTIQDLKPNLTIGTIKGGLLRLTSTIQNIGEANASNVLWKITIGGRFILSGYMASGTIDSLDMSSTATIENRPIFGFGSILITVTVSADGVPEIIKTTKGFIFLIFIIV